MLIDTSLTNTLYLSGLSTIKYKTYTQSYIKESIVSYLQRTPSYNSLEGHQNPLIDAYHYLISLNIPSQWHISSQTSDTLTLELWVFWFGDRHTETIDNINDLKELRELKAGSFNWNQVQSNSLSPSASPHPSNSATESTSLTPVKEYKLFINSIRNLIRHTMIVTRHAFVMGEFFIFPDTTVSASTMLACMYNIYLTTTNLVFQPNTRRMRIRPLVPSDALLKNKVLLCPTGEQAKIISFQSLPTLELQDKVLKEWAEFYRIPLSQLSPTNKHLPSLVTIRTASQDTIVYPTNLTFVPTDTKLSPASAAGMNGIMGLNHGLIEDLGSKAARLSYCDRLKSNDPHMIDYWSYCDPVVHSGNTIMHALSTIDAKCQQDQVLLHRALIEPVLGSSIMNSKSVIPFHRDSPALIRKPITPPSDTLPTISIDLQEFATSSFQIKQEQSDLLNGLNPLQDPNIAMVQSNDNLETAGETNDVKTEQEQISDQQQQLEAQEILATILPEDSTIEQMPLPIIEEDYTMGGLMYDLNGRVDSRVDSGEGPWNRSENFGDFDLDVTEADFDFFEASIPAAPSAPEIVPNLLNIMPIETGTEQRLVMQEKQTNDVEMTEATAATAHDTPNNDSLFTPFVISNSNTEDLSAETSSVGNNSSNSTPMMQQQQQKQPALKNEPSTNTTTTEHQFLCVPRDFLPVPVSAGVNDAKYSSGGKFMYVPLRMKKKDNDIIEKKAPLLAKVLKRRDFNYSPDYVPKLLTTKKKAIPKPNPISTTALQKPALTSESLHMMDIDRMEEKKNTDSDSSVSTSSSDSSDSALDDDSDSDSSSSSEVSTKLEQVVDKRLQALKKFQTSFVNRLLKATPAPLPTSQNMDYDTPFAPMLADGGMKPIKWRQSKAMEQSMEHLCQQALLGGYPFAGGVAEVSQHGGEIETELAKLMVARRTNLMQVTRGTVTHIPSLQTDLHKMTIDFKHMLKQIFLYPESADTLTMSAVVASDGISTPVSEDLSISTEPGAYLGGSLLGKIDIKGPLNIQQYYDLNEAHNQTHSKYGKYHIKKKRPDEPNLDILKQPGIVVSRHEDFLEGSPKMIPFWEKLGLEPYSAKKHIKYFVVYPDNVDIKSSVVRFFQSLSSVYELCHLGRHDPGQAGAYHLGLVPVPLISITEENETSVRQRLKSYEETFEQLGSSLASSEGHANQLVVHTVIYIVSPGPHMSTYLDMCRCFYKLKEAYEKIPRQKQQARLTLQLVPIDHVLKTSAFGGYTMMGMKDIAFSVYSKCFGVVSRKTPSTKENSKTNLYAPPFVLTRSLQKKIDFKLNSIRSFPIILDQHSTLHMAYCFSYDRAWMSVVWIDDRGELLEYDLFSRKSAHKEAWKRTLEIAKRTEFPWTIVIAKVGLMFNDELIHWLRYTSSAKKYQVAIIAVDMESGLNLHFHMDYSDTMASSDSAQNRSQQASTFLDASGKSHIIHTTGYQNAGNQRKNSSELVNSEAQILLLNHRISYSHKRDRAYKGILRLEAITEKENWMMPLATGYLVQHSLTNKSVNPCMEQFNNAPFVAEIHLLYNRSHHSAYSALHDIIKKLYALSFINPIPSCHSCIPFHIVLAERLSRLLLVIDS